MLMLQWALKVAFTVIGFGCGAMVVILSNRKTRKIFNKYFW
jgi:hypothetical protein